MQPNTQWIARASNGDAAMATIEVNFLFTLEMSIEDRNQVIGAIPHGKRAIGYVNGTFSGPGIKGAIRACDWFLTRADGMGEADVRGIMKTDDGALIYMNYQGLLDLRGVGGAPPEAGVCPIRTTVRFETSAEKYLDLNSVQAIGIGEVSFASGEIKYSIYAL
jgi:uncharacterized protein DUF3237